MMRFVTLFVLCLFASCLVGMPVNLPAWAASQKTEPTDNDQEKDAGDEVEDEAAKPQRELSFIPLPEKGVQPWKLIRDLQLMQDQLVAGDRDAFNAYRREMGDIGTYLLKADDSVWQHQRNLDAVAVYLLMGGQSLVGEKALAQSRLEALDLLPLRAAIAFALRDITDAVKLFEQFELTHLPLSARGQFAYATSMLFAASSRIETQKWLDQARLVAPGTLVEEAALRRLVFLSGDQGEIKALRKYARSYIERFERSPYFGDFVNKFQSAIFNNEKTKAQILEPLLREMTEGLPPGPRLETLTRIAHAAIIDNRLELAKWACQTGLPLAEQNERLGALLRLYLAAAIMLEKDNGLARAAKLIDAVKADGLDLKNQNLYKGVRRLIAQLQAEPKLLKAQKKQPDRKARASEKVKTGLTENEKSRQVSNTATQIDAGQALLERGSALLEELDRIR